jgi:hypothetical protein
MKSAADMLLAFDEESKTTSTWQRPLRPLRKKGAAGQ